MALFWVITFIASLAAVVKGADWLLSKAEKIGLAAGLSPFIIGVTIISVGTSFPELISSFVAAWQGLSEFAAANAIGSNLSNILLIIGLSSVIGGRLAVSKNLIDVELPLLAIGTGLFLIAAWDRHINLFEAIIMIAIYVVYILYTSLHRDTEDQPSTTLPSRRDRREHTADQDNAPAARPKINFTDIAMLIIGIIALGLGAKYLIDSVIALSTIFNIGVDVITITAVAIGTSLPELLVSAKAAWQKKSEVALGNIFGSNAFNIMVVVGLPALFFPTTLDHTTFTIGLPVMALATLLFVISGISRRIHLWEGLFYLGVYALFISKLFGFS